MRWLTSWVALDSHVTFETVEGQLEAQPGYVEVSTAVQFLVPGASRLLAQGKPASGAMTDEDCVEGVVQIADEDGAGWERKWRLAGSELLDLFRVAHFTNEPVQKQIVLDEIVCFRDRGPLAIVNERGDALLFPSKSVVRLNLWSVRDGAEDKLCLHVPVGPASTTAGQGPCWAITEWVPKVALFPSILSGRRIQGVERTSVPFSTGRGQVRRQAGVTHVPRV